MFKKFHIELAQKNNHSKSIILTFKVRKDKLSQLWAKQINNKFDLYERDRFVNWPNSNKNNLYYAKQINKQIEKINSFYPDKVKHFAKENMDQDLLNKLHVYFEKLRGPIETPTLFYKESPKIVKDAINKLNQYIHEYEDLQYSKDLGLPDHPNSSLIGTYKDDQFFKLNHRDYRKFTYRYKFGTVYLTYCLVGKPILDVFLNKDEDCGHDNIRPQRHWCADWQIKFGPSIPEKYIQQKEKEFKKWLKSNLKLLRSLGIYPNPKMSLGLIPVAEMDKTQFKGLTDSDIMKLLGKYQYLKATWVT